MGIKKVTVLGSGTMGHGIAQISALKGYDVYIYDIDQGMLDKAVGIISKSIDRHFVSKGKLSREDGDAVIARIKISTDLNKAVKDADLVIEAIPENMDLKKEVFEKLDRFCPEHTILASNTSVLSVTAIGGATKRPDKVVGLHFFNPPVVMKLVEVVKPIGVSDDTLNTVIEWCRSIGKNPVPVKDVPGFIVNRLLLLLYNEAAQIVLEGTASAEEVDTAMRLGAGHPMGPCELADFGGFDVVANAGDGVYNYTHKERDAVNILFRKMIEAGRLGRKNGKGYYDYHDDGTKTTFKLFN